MAALVLKTMGKLNEERTTVYPLFQKGAKSTDTCQRDDDGQEGNANAILIRPASAVSKPNGSVEEQPEPRATISAGTRQDSSMRSGPSKIIERAFSLEIDPNNIRKKRRKTDSPGGKESQFQANNRPKAHQAKRTKPGRTPNSPVHQSETQTGRTAIVETSAIESDAPNDTSNDAPKKFGQRKQSRKDEGFIVIKDYIVPEPSSESSATVTTGTMPQPQSAVSTITNGMKPKKLLKLNPKTGTIGSPPARRITPVKHNAATKQAGQNVTVIRYGRGRPLPQDLGFKIEKILKGPSALDGSQGKIPSKPSIKIPNISQPNRPVHPLFLGKATSTDTQSRKSRPDTASCPIHSVDKQGLAKGHTDRLKPRPMSSSLVKTSASPFPGFGHPQHILKFPGAMTPAWPWNGMVHIRGHSPPLSNGTTSKVSDSRSRNCIKGKHNAIQISPSEDIIRILANDLNIVSILHDIQDINLDNFPLPPMCLRLPIKHYETGTKLQKRIRGNVKLELPRHSLLDESSEDEIQAQGAVLTHFAISKMYELVGTSMSAFDQGQCEGQAWIHKHSPKSAAEVLQTGRDAHILKDWLQQSMVQSIEGGLGQVTKSSGLSSKPDAGKRKRKRKKLDGFVVSSDEESDDMNEITEPEDNGLIHCGRGTLRKTVVRAGDRSAKDPGKLKNAILISGPHGCGKTATAYAVAKELGFEIFEINPSSRRSGKDIMEKVGDMTKNHLVQRQSLSLTQSADTELESIVDIDETLASDIQSGRQGTMGSFFKPKKSTVTKPKMTAPTLASIKPTANTAPTIKAPSKQKQSLILLEEVDILYEEDKQFWSTVMNLIATSKRPIIMTCTDESAVPILPLHAIIRLNSPPTNLATDYLLLLAACEGHVLRREAVKALYEARQMDLRASISELNFWCQFAVGDQKCGLDWFYRRYPAKDKDNQIRVVSEETYQPGMGYLCHDFLNSNVQPLDVEEEILHEAWDGWNIDAGDWQSHARLNEWVAEAESRTYCTEDKMKVLNIYEQFAEGMSVADLCSGRIFAPDLMADLDLSLPKLTSKARDDYVVAYSVLEASPVTIFNSTGQDMSLWMKSRFRNHLHRNHELGTALELDQYSEKDLMRLIRHEKTTVDTSLTRRDLSSAFDPISEPEQASLFTPGNLEASCFDRPKRLIVEDLAPYVRSIVSYDARLQQERARLSNLMSENGRSSKKMRTTRAAMSALEGGARSTTRKDRYFGPSLNPELVLRTGKQSWLDAMAIDIGSVGESHANGSRRSSLAEASRTHSGIDE